MTVRRVGSPSVPGASSVAAPHAPQWLPRPLTPLWPFMNWAAEAFAKQLREQEKRKKELLEYAAKDWESKRRRS